MERQLESPMQETRKARATDLLGRFVEGLNSIVNSVLNRVPKSDPQTRQDVKDRLAGTNPPLAQKVTERGTSSPGHAAAGRAYEREIAEPKEKKKT